MPTGDRDAHILELLYGRGPLSDDALSTEIIGDQGEADQVAPLTAELEAQGLIEDSEVAPRAGRSPTRAERPLGTILVARPEHTA